MNFGKNLKRIRSEKGMREIDVAAASGIREADIMRFERGLNMPRLKTAAAIARALGVTLDDLMDKKSQPAA